MWCAACIALGMLSIVLRFHANCELLMLIWFSVFRICELSPFENVFSLFVLFFPVVCVFCWVYTYRLADLLDSFRPVIVAWQMGPPNVLRRPKNLQTAWLFDIFYCTRRHCIRYAAIWKRGHNHSIWYYVKLVRGFHAQKGIDLRHGHVRLCIALSLSLSHSLGDWTICQGGIGRN